MLRFPLPASGEGRGRQAARGGGGGEVGCGVGGWVGSGGDGQRQEVTSSDPDRPLSDLPRRLLVNTRVGAQLSRSRSVFVLRRWALQRSRACKVEHQRSSDSVHRCR